MLPFLREVLLSAFLVRGQTLWKAPDGLEGKVLDEVENLKLAGVGCWKWMLADALSERIKAPRTRIRTYISKFSVSTGVYQVAGGAKWAEGG